MKRCDICRCCLALLLFALILYIIVNYINSKEHFPIRESVLLSATGDFFIPFFNTPTGDFAQYGLKDRHIKLSIPPDLPKEVSGKLLKAVTKILATRTFKKDKDNIITVIVTDNQVINIKYNNGTPTYEVHKNYITKPIIAYDKEEGDVYIFDKLSKSNISYYKNSIKMTAFNIQKVVVKTLHDCYIYEKYLYILATTHKKESNIYKYHLDDIPLSKKPSTYLLEQIVTIKANTDDVTLIVSKKNHNPRLYIIHKGTTDYNYYILDEKGNCLNTKNPLFSQEKNVTMAHIDDYIDDRLYYITRHAKGSSGAAEAVKGAAKAAGAAKVVKAAEAEAMKAVKAVKAAEAGAMKAVAARVAKAGESVQWRAGHKGK